MEELLALVDARGVPTGVVIRRGDPMPEGMYRQICDAWIVNSRGELLIQQRSMQKRNWPGLWADSAGGAVQAGESPEEGCRREVLEEIGVDVDFSCGGKVFEYLASPRLHHVFVFFQNVDLTTLTLQQGEVDAARYASPDEIRRMAAEGTFAASGYLEQLLQMLPVLAFAHRKDAHA